MDVPEFIALYGCEFDKGQRQPCKKGLFSQRNTPPCHSFIQSGSISADFRHPHSSSPPVQNQSGLSASIPTSHHSLSTYLYIGIGSYPGCPERLFQRCPASA